MLKDSLLYIDEHLSCSHYVSDYRCSFRYKEVLENTHVDIAEHKYNLLIFLLEGEVKISCNEFTDRLFTAGNIIFLPRSSDITFITVTDTKFLSFIFDVPHSVCDKLIFQSLHTYCATMNYDFEATPIKGHLNDFIEMMVNYLKQGINCEHLHEIKNKELFLIFKWFYTKEELAYLFYPIIGRSLDFKALILDNYLKTEKVDDLARISGMGRSNFDSTFKKVFGMPARQWMLKQTASHVRHYLTQPDATISDAMVKFGFNSLTHFNRFCKQQFGCSPTQLLKDIRNE